MGISIRPLIPPALSRFLIAVHGGASRSLRRVPGLFRVSLALLLTLSAAQALAAVETYKGMLVPESLETPIPVTLELNQTRFRLTGHVTTLPPLSGEGPIVSGEKQRSSCTFTANLGHGRSIAFEGLCLSKSIEGTYTVMHPDGSSRRGTYNLLRADPEPTPARATAPEDEEGPVRTTTACLRAHTGCLAACPRENYNAAFLCTNRCRQQLTACRLRVSGSGTEPADAVLP